MSSELIANIRGGYRFLPGIEPYSSGVIADDGHEIVHVLLARCLPWNAGLRAARRYLESVGRDQHALCGVELRCATPHSMNGFIEFNREYRALLDEWAIPVDDENPIARTNVSPVICPPAETVLFGFSFTVPSKSGERTFVVAGGGELPTRKLDSARIIRLGEVDADAMRAKAECVIGIMRHRMKSLTADDDVLSAVNVYTRHEVQPLLDRVIIDEFPAAANRGVHWYYSRPPVIDIEFEMDMRGVRQERTVELLVSE